MSRRHNCETSSNGVTWSLCAACPAHTATSAMVRDAQPARTAGSQEQRAIGEEVVKSYCMDNFCLDVTARFPEVLHLAMSIVARQHDRVVGYQLSDGKLVAYWAEGTDGMMKLPFAMTIIGFANFALDWLESADYGKEPDHDGDNSKGWRVQSGAGEWRILCTIEPVWAMHGK